MENLSKTRRITTIAMMTALICILAPLTIPIPFSLVPLSLCNFALFLSAYLLGWKYSTLSCILYLLIGAVGIPVFSGFGSGVGKLAGPTGGYLIGYLLTTLIAGLFIDKFDGKRAWSFLGMALGTLGTYALGTIWLAFQGHMTFAAALMAGVVPFIPGDIIKALCACAIGPVIRKRVMKV